MNKQTAMSEMNDSPLNNPLAKQRRREYVATAVLVAFVGGVASSKAVATSLDVGTPIWLVMTIWAGVVLGVVRQSAGTVFLHALAVSAVESTGYVGRSVVRWLLDVAQNLGAAEFELPGFVIGSGVALGVDTESWWAFAAMAVVVWIAS